MPKFSRYSPLIFPVSGTKGISHRTCSDVYCGARSASEPETEAVVRAIERIKKRTNNQLKAFFTIHSFSQLLLYPFGDTDHIAENEKDLAEVADAGVRAIRDHEGKRYRPGPAGATIYETSGGSQDWAADPQGAHIPYSYTFELRPTRWGRGGFQLDSSQIRGTVREVTNSIAAMLEVIKSKEGLN